MALVRIVLSLTAVMTCLIGTGLACRAPLKPFVTSAGAIATCRHDGECPSLYECRLLWLGVKVCCPLPFAPIDKPAPTGDGELIEGDTDRTANQQPGTDPTEALRYYYVYVTASTPPPPPPAPPPQPPAPGPIGLEKSLLPNLALTYDKLFPDPRIAAAAPPPQPLPPPPPSPPHSPLSPLPPPPPPPPTKPQEAKTGKDPPAPRYPLINFQAPVSYTGEPLPPSYNYAPLATSIFDIYSIGSLPAGIRKPSVHQPRVIPAGRTAGPIHPAPSFFNPYQYASYSYLRPRAAKTD